MNEKEARETLKTMKENIDKKYLKTRNSLAIETVLNLLENKDKQIEQYQNMLATNDMLHVLECEKKDKIIDEIQKEVRDHIGFENRLKRDNKEPDLFNQGRFYVANNINNIMKGK